MSELDPAELPNGRRSVQHDPFGDEPADLSPAAPSTSRKHDREGLPPGYRMRAEPHYVDQLSSRRAGRQVDDLQPRAPAPECETADIDRADRERGRAQLLSRLGEGLGAIASASALLAGDASPLARHTNIDVIRAEAWRAAWLVSSQAVLEGGTRPQIKVRTLGPILERVRQGFAPECRLSGASLVLSASDWSASVSVDEPSLMTGVTGAILATFGLLGRIEGSTIRLSADAVAGNLRAIEVSQEEVPLPESAARRFFDAGWAERPGGWIAGLGARVARAAAEQHGGDAVFLVGDRRGSTIRMTLGS